MLEEARFLLQGWLDDVAGRPNGICGIFFEGDGQAFGPRGRPWDEPDLLIEGRVEADCLILRADGAHGAIDLRLADLDEVIRDDHPWGSAIRISGILDGRRYQIWLV